MVILTFSLILQSYPCKVKNELCKITMYNRQSLRKRY
nr:MAG TPA: hypothetical protein [Caudoviricetes sp.]